MRERFADSGALINKESNFRNEMWRASTAQDVQVLVSLVGTIYVTVVNAET